MAPITYKPSRTTDFFYKINMINYLFGFPNFWIDNFKLPKLFIKIYNHFTAFCSVIICLWVISICAAYFTQHNLTKKQLYKLLFCGISHSAINIYNYVLIHHHANIKATFYNLAVVLKRIHSDSKVERHVIANTTRYITAFILACSLSMFMQTFDACLDMVHNNATFTVIITAYPDVLDNSKPANIMRAICYIIWWLFLLRTFATYILVLSLTISLSHQYTNLQSYFYTLGNIFHRKDLTQKQKEEQYEKQFKIGINFHSDTIRCTTQCQTVCGVVYSGQIILNILGILVLMVQMVKSERNFTNLGSTVLTAGSLLISTGFIMWNAGDITVEASRLPGAIYSSGWENCEGPSSVRVRKFVTSAITFAQRPVVLKGLGYIELSYQAYVTIVKASYSAFSMLA